MAAKKVALHSLGCKVNQNEAAALLNIFRHHGYEVVDFDQVADVYLIHTCTVTHLGDRKSRQVIRRAVKKNPAATVVVSGCYAQVSPEEVLEIPGVDLVIGTQDRSRILELVERVEREKTPMNAVRDILHTRDFEELPLEHSGRVRAFLKIQEGCQQFCSYCIIPFARGPVRSRDPEKTLQEVRRLVEHGYKEIVLTGIHTGAYGQDLDDEVDLGWLVRQLSKIRGLKRLRISSLDPNEFTPEFIETITTTEIVCPHFHISLQSGDDDILDRMRRRYTTDEYRDLVSRLRARIPDLGLTTDVMVGFPGETGEQHRNSLKFVEEIGFSGLHVFKYSPRAGTKAATYRNQVAPEVKEQRSKEMIALGEKMAQSFARKFLGKSMEVLVEQRDGNGLWEGHTGNYLKVKFASEQELRGELVQVNLKELAKDSLLGQLQGCAVVSR
ncbi:tRNA (N(6)-L-threonylcarbamoyladenosine(37)-C(2))-methylthiotransferase MtaB [Zhaonella formicivorans]|uniref:tRNA (N(6)-L-threonylcarbamoyladenosine(37)-C(2))- methylthiotransferase MtaB n=1 Tax=Zhaonella formicivorans TaxID=2528593 RepID=UPI0010E6FA28|nr:tRNA (N(6)-L-threonylcarbamoyladenosine(37)-C(2))-methylthiotransferase MtaB [Zhaonella formicivorans]